METVDLRPRSERFARAVARGASYTAAAREAGYSVSSCRAAGSRLMSQPAIKSRVRQLLSEAPTEIFDREGRHVGFLVAASSAR